MKIKQWLHRQFKKKARIYIMPTRMGGYLNGLIFLMFLLSVGYSNNLLLIFTLILFAFNLIWVIQTHFHLHKLKLKRVSVGDSFASEEALIEVEWSSLPAGPTDWELVLENFKDSFSVNGLRMTFEKRGFYEFQHLKVRTQMPFGLYTAWIYFPVKVSAYVYPERLTAAPPIDGKRLLQEGLEESFKKGPHDLWDLRAYQGEELRKISWKHYARSGELLIKEGEELLESEVHFKLPEVVPNKELELSKMATQMSQCLRLDIPFSFESPSVRTKALKSDLHLKECLRELARC